MSVYQVEGGRELRRSLKAAGDDLQDLRETHRQVGTFVTSAALPRTPRRSGNLAATGRAGATKTAALARFGGARSPYANAIHWGEKKRRRLPARPWVTEAAQATEPTWTTMYEQGVERVLARIKGA